MSNVDIAGYVSLGADINKEKAKISPEIDEGFSQDKLPELDLKKSDEDILKLAVKWEKKWVDSSARSEWIKQGEENEQYWLGKQFDKPHADKTRSMVDNLIFESLETYLPQTTRRNPEPLVAVHSKDKTDDVDISNIQEKYTEKVKDRLTDIADELKLRLKLKGTARHWALYLLGVVKFGWDLDKDIPAVKTVRAKKILLDPDATITEDGYSGERIGEYRKLTAGRIIEIIRDEEGAQGKVKFIKDHVKDDLATELTFIEWWTSDSMFWKFKDKILFKKKNPHWNYERDVIDTAVDTFGNETLRPKSVDGINHLPVPSMPYRFLVVFNLGDKPMDNTSLIGQNLSNQDLINKRNRQIDKNADSMNGGMVVSLARSGLTQPQAKGVTAALRKGGTVVIPDGTPRDAIERMSAPNLPSDVYNNLADTRIRLREVFGTSGSSPAGVRAEDTVRGKIINRGLDTDRIGGGVTEYLEQLADDIYNFMVQLLYVYDNDFQFIGEEKPPKLIVSVKEGSLLPKDSISIANQALELARMNRMSNLDLYKRLEYPNPEELAANVWLEQNAPQVLYKDNPMVQEAIAATQPQEEIIDEGTGGIPLEESIPAQVPIEPQV